MTSPALSELGVTEFLAIARAGFHPVGLVTGSCVYSAGSQYNWRVATAEITSLSTAMRQARVVAIDRMRQQARALDADGVVDVRLEVEHHLWRNARQVAKCVAVGTAIKFHPERAPAHLRDAPSLRLESGPFDSDLGGSEFVTLLAAGYRPITVAMGNCVYGLDPRTLRAYRGSDAELAEYTTAFRDARELAMERLQHDLFAAYPKGSRDVPSGIVGMTVSESVHGGNGALGPPIVEFMALGTAIAPLLPDDPRRQVAPPTPRMVVPLDR